MANDNVALAKELGASSLKVCLKGLNQVADLIGEAARKMQVMAEAVELLPGGVVIGPELAGMLNDLVGTIGHYQNDRFRDQNRYRDQLITEACNIAAQWSQETS